MSTCHIVSEDWLDAEFEIDADGDLRITLGSDGDMSRVTYLTPAQMKVLRDWLNQIAYIRELP